MFSEILGVKPTKPEFDEFIVAPRPNELAWAEGVVPSPKGDIFVRWEQTNGKFKLDIIVPENSKANQLLRSKDSQGKVIYPFLHKLGWDIYSGS